MLNSARIVLSSIPMSLLTLDGRLLDFGPRLSMTGLRRFLVEFFYLASKKRERACSSCRWGFGEGLGYGRWIQERHSF
jgi:hypothetical protein